jgi:tetratricopeptide (TPR) repeat protein
MNEDDLELANMYGCKIAKIEMTDNFSAARNAILNHCTMSYVLQLDLDERLTNWGTLRRLLDATNTDAWIFSINNYQKTGEAIVTDTTRLFKNDGKVAYWGYLHETVDNYIAQNGWKLAHSPIKINHFGYLDMTKEQAWKKMQRYIDINIKQIKDFPMDGRAYYNLAIHLLEDNCVDDALRLLQVSATLAPRFPLSAMEIGKTHIEKAHFWMERAQKLIGQHHPNHTILGQFKDALEKIRPHNIPGAPGHCLQYFNTHPEASKWLKEHVEEMEAKIDKIKLAALEKQK